MLLSMRWKLWEVASWIAYWLCPDKKALDLVARVGTINARKALDEARSARGGK